MILLDLGIVLTTVIGLSTVIEGVCIILADWRHGYISKLLALSSLFTGALLTVVTVIALVVYARTFR